MVSKSIEITWTNGELVLIQKNTNYSYGSLQRILRLVVLVFKIIKMNHVLILGVAMECSKTLVDEIKFEGRITESKLILKLFN
jgi:hypothetical protein